MTIKTNWIRRQQRSPIKPNHNEAVFKNELKEKLGLSPFLIEILINRDCSSIEETKRFLNPTTSDLHDPFLFKDMEKVVNRILQAKEHNEMICLYGDYDADGTIGTSILFKYMKTHGFNISYFIPNRLITGYGLHQTPLEDIIDSGVSLLITIDNGISANEQVEFCNAHSLDVIITDHHECHGTLPNALGIINPKLPDTAYPFKELCGAGVAFKLLQALCLATETAIDYQEFIECVALATVADLVPLQDENRCFVSLGLNYLNQCPKNPGIRALIEVSELSELKAWHFGFVLGPKINAAGRLGEANKIVELLTNEDQEKITNLAKFLSEENRKRQELEAQILESALEKVQSQNLDEEDVLIVVGENWHSGVIGIVASRIQDKYFKPVIIISIENGVGKASCRSVEGFNIFEALQSASDLFLSFGGHEQAAGFSINEENIEIMSEKIINYGKMVELQRHLVKKIYYDTEISEDEIYWNLYEELLQIEPCGLGNPGVQFVINEPKIISMGTMGKENNHLRVALKNDLRGVGFNLGFFYLSRPDLMASNYAGIQLLARLDMNEFRGKKSLQLLIKDIKQNPIWQIDSAMRLVRTIVKEDNPKEVISTAKNDVCFKDLQVELKIIRTIYQLLKKSAESGLPLQNTTEISQWPSPYHLLMSCEILREAGLLAYRINDGMIFSKIIATTEKKDIQNTKLMIKLEKMIND
nr:single-stranded-DNA-specific exonuclease RecJ [uncultured Acetobacterium sp.]